VHVLCGFIESIQLCHKEASGVGNEEERFTDLR